MEVDQEEPWTLKNDDRVIGELIVKVLVKVFSLDFFVLSEA